MFSKYLGKFGKLEKATEVSMQSIASSWSVVKVPLLLL